MVKLDFILDSILEKISLDKKIGVVKYDIKSNANDLLEYENTLAGVDYMEGRLR